MLAYFCGFGTGLLAALLVIGTAILLAVHHYGLTALLRGRRSPLSSLPPVDLGRPLTGGRLPADLSAYTADPPPVPKTGS